MRKTPRGAERRRGRPISRGRAGRLTQCTPPATREWMRGSTTKCTQRYRHASQRPALCHLSIAQTRTPTQARPGQTKAAARHPNCTACRACAPAGSRKGPRREHAALVPRSARVPTACQRLPADRACAAGKHTRDMLARRHVGREQDQQKLRGRMLRHV